MKYEDFKQTAAFKTAIELYRSRKGRRTRIIPLLYDFRGARMRIIWFEDDICFNVYVTLHECKTVCARGKFINSVFIYDDDDVELVQYEEL